MAPFRSAGLRALCIAIACGATGLPSRAQEERTAHPANIDQRLELIGKRIRLDPVGEADVLVVKYDHKLGANWGLNFEWPIHMRIEAPGFAAQGQGDLFTRVRWILPSRTWSYGAAVEIVLPAASNAALGTGRYQVNAALFALHSWSRRLAAAYVLKQITSLDGDRERAEFSNTEVRIVPVWHLADGWAVAGELRQTWEHRGRPRQWRRAEISIDRSLTQGWSAVLGYSRDFGDRPDRGTVFVTAKQTF